MITRVYLCVYRLDTLTRLLLTRGTWLAAETSSRRGWISRFTSGHSTTRRSSLVARNLAEGPVYFVASPGFLSKYGTPSAKDLQSARCVGFGPFETWQVEGMKSRIDPVLTVNDLEVACEAAIAGVGIARVPAILCREAVRDGRLKILFGPKPAMLRTVYAVYPSRLNLPAKVRLFVDAMETFVEPMLPLHRPLAAKALVTRRGLNGESVSRRLWLNPPKGRESPP